MTTPGTTSASGGRFPSGHFDDKGSVAAGAPPKPTKTGAIYNPAAVNLKSGAFKGGGSSSYKTQSRQIHRR